MSQAAMQPAIVPERERELERYRTELTGFCYRMLGSPFDAEDAVQDTLVRAWRALDRFEGRAALRSWLFGIATNVCIDMLNAGRRRALPMDLSLPSHGDAAPGAPLPEHRWIVPIADERALALSADPAETVVRRESIRLAFVAALQFLPPRQRAVLILRDVLRWKATEVAELLGSSTVAVHSLLRRARAVLADADLPRVGKVLGDDARARALVDRYVDAFERFDVDALVALLHEDVTLSMPPYPLWMRGADAVRTWFLAASDECRDTRLVPVRANGCPAVAIYRRGHNSYEAFGIQVMDVSTSGITAMYAFLDPRLFAVFGLPPALQL